MPSSGPATVVLIAIFAGLGVPLCHAAVLDQSQLVGDQSIAIFPGNYISQSFVPQTPGFLSAVEVSLDLDPLGGTLRVEVWSGSLRVGLVELNDGDEGTMPSSLVAGSVTGTLVDFTPFAIPTVPGVSMEVRIHHVGGTEFATIRRNTAGGYDNGGSTNNGAGIGGDLVFKTFVEETVALGGFDHFQPDGVAQSVALLAGSSVGQTMTAVWGGRLQAIELSLTAPAGADADLLVDVFRLSARGAALVGSVAVTAAHIRENLAPLFLHHAEVRGTLVDLAALGIELLPGEKFEIRFRTSNTVGLYTVRRTTTDVYGAGDGTLGGTPVGNDLAFKLFLSGAPYFADGFESGSVAAWQ